MDPTSNWQEQRETAAAVMRIWDACSDDGNFTEDQAHSLVHYAYRQAELFQALDGVNQGHGARPEQWK